MNERIQQLAEQCRAEYPDTEWPDATHYRFDEAKFAELIIQECADICNKIYFERYPDAEDFERSEEGDAIKKHFGVRE